MNLTGWGALARPEEAFDIVGRLTLTGQQLVSGDPGGAVNVGQAKIESAATSPSSLDAQANLDGGAASGHSGCFQPRLSTVP
jgi:hypothetical protein